MAMANPIHITLKEASHTTTSCEQYDGFNIRVRFVWRKKSIKSDDRRFYVFWPGQIKATISIKIKCGCDVLKNVLLSL